MAQPQAGVWHEYTEIDKLIMQAMESGREIIEADLQIYESKFRLHRRLPDCWADCMSDEYLKTNKLKWHYSHDYDVETGVDLVVVDEVRAFMVVPEYKGKP